MASARWKTAPRPIAGLCLGASLAMLMGVCICGGVARANVGDPSRGATLTEDQAVQRALDNPALAELRSGWIAEAEADGLEQSRWQNPSLSYTREQLLGTNAQGEDYLTLSQQFDLSGRRSLARRAAEKRKDAASQSADVTFSEIATEVRRRYYRLLLAQQREGALEVWQHRVESHLRLVARREAAGDAAAYERIRLQLESTRIDAQISKERATAARAWAGLRALIDGHAMPRLRGPLLPRPSATSKQQLVDGTSELPAARAREAEAQALSLDARASSRWWIPNPSIGGGYKSVEVPGGGRAHGFVFTLSLPIPALDRGHVERARAAAQSRSLRAETSLATAETRGQAAGLWEEAAVLSAAARTMLEDGARLSTELINTAEAGYRGGEFGVMELLDAYRSAAANDLMALDLSMRARLAEIELTRLSGARS